MGRVSSWMRGNVLGLVAIFIALTGTAFAATAAKNSVTSKSIKQNAVKSGDVKNETLTADDIADSATADLRGPQGPQGIQGERGLHLCFGNYGGQSIQKGFWADMLGFLNYLKVDHLVLEFARRGYDELPVFKDLRPGIALGVGVIDIKDKML